MNTTVNSYQKSDLVAIQKVLAIHNAKLVKAIDSDNFAEACSAIRAIENECLHASRIAGALSLKNAIHNKQLAPLISRGANTGALENGTL